jgi:hypothetical protein
MKRPPPTADSHAQIRLRLLDLAEDASLYLRRSAEPSVRVAAALLLAASLAACSSSGSTSTSSSSDDAPAVPPLTQEVKEGLPNSPGTYPVSANSLSRDAQGVYGLSWRNPTGAATWNQGRASLMKLAQGTEDTLEVPESGDPTLRLKPDTPITLPDDDGPTGGPTPTPRTSNASTSSSSSSSGNRSIAWYPFFTGGGATTASTSPGSSASTDTVAPTTPAYRNPPAAEPGQGSVRGASSSLSAPTSSARTWTSPSRAAATGQAGGPGSGTAASSRSGAGTSTAQGASRPGSSSFSGGKSGSSAGSSSSSSSG